MNAPRNYLDCAATSWPKPEAVYVAMDRYAREIGAAAGRGEYRAALAASEIVASCRRRLMRLVNAAEASQIAFFANGTAALNAAIFGSLGTGDHVVTSAAEHNSVLRPLEELRRRGDIRLDIVDCDSQGYVDLDQMIDRITPHTALVVLTHASNVTGAVQEIDVIGNRLRDTPTRFLCDAAQTLGYLPVDVRTSAIDLLAAPGHKGTCGPLGTGMLYVSPKAASRLRPTTFGGTGSISHSLLMPERMPEMLESGNLNVPAIAGWNAALEYLASQDLAMAEKHRAALCERMSQSFAKLDHGFSIVGRELPIASLVFDELDPAVIGALLDSDFGIDVRCGWHCAALIHHAIDAARTARLHATPTEYRGTLRLSGGHFTQIEQIDAAAAAIHDLVAELTRATSI